MIVLTVGKSYVDIDGYASCLAYRELLKMLKIESKLLVFDIRLKGCNEVIIFHYNPFFRF